MSFGAQAVDVSNMPLAGVTVIDLGQIYQGPYAALLMAKAGADVIKVEPLNGDSTRRRGAPDEGSEIDALRRDGTI
jgi:crotonobetainyl-CoA:carnitine CoA-transferase CaiB-like acyl-CoA transferase